MNATVEKISSNKVKISFEVEAEQFLKALDSAFHKNAKRINIPGFRKGKAPLQVIESFYGREVFYDDAFNEIFPDLFDKVVEENKLEVVDRPSVDFQQLERGKDMIFTCEVFVRPDVALGEYKGVEVVRIAPEVDPTAVESEINRARENAARLVEVETPAEKGDTVLLDYEGFADGVPFEGGKGEDHELELGSNSFIPGFEDQLIGAVAGEAREVNVTFPEQYHAPELAGKPAVFKCTVKAVQKKELPELDDEFAQDVSEFDTFEEYKKSLEEKYAKQAQEQADVRMENAMIDTIVERATIDVPQAMIVREADSMINSFAQRMQAQGLSLDMFMRYTGQTIENMRAQYMTEAEHRVRIQLTLEAIAKAENVEPTEDEVSDQIDKIAMQQNLTPEELKERMQPSDMDYIRDMVRMQKTVDMLKTTAVYVDAPEKPAEPAEAAEAEAPAGDGETNA